MAERVLNVDSAEMNVDKITLDDSRVKKASTTVNGREWHYLDTAARGQQKGVVVLIHGFPDLAIGWRYQIPMLTELGLRVIALDCQGYGDTGASPDLSAYTFKSHGEAIQTICNNHGIERIILGGHDWGGALVWRVAQWMPEFVQYVFAVCTPYFPVADQYVPTEVLVQGPLPQFGYQLQLGSEEQVFEKVVNGEKAIRNFFQGTYGGKPSSGRPFMVPTKGWDLDVVVDDQMSATPLMSEEEMDYYVAQFTKVGMNGPCNWYRMRKRNFDDEVDMPAAQRNGVQQPALFIAATQDQVLLPSMSLGMDKAIPNLSRGEVPSSHWALTHTPKSTNDILRNWINGVVFGGKSKI